MPLPCPICERDDKLFAEGDNVPFILPRNGDILSDDNTFPYYSMFHEEYNPI